LASSSKLKPMPAAVLSKIRSNSPARFFALASGLLRRVNRSGGRKRSGTPGSLPRECPGVASPSSYIITPSRGRHLANRGRKLYHAVKNFKIVAAGGISRNREDRPAGVA